MKRVARDQAVAALDKWALIAARASASEPHEPIATLALEAVELSHFIREHWRPVKGRGARPGLQSAVASGDLEDTIASDLEELALSLQHVNAEFRASRPASPVAPVARGRALLGELKRCLAFVLAPGDLGRLRENASASRSHDGLALALETLAHQASKQRRRLAQLPGFQAGHLDEALVVAQRLREQSGIKLAQRSNSQRREKRLLRNGLVTLLKQRMKDARRTARFVFRHHPALALRAGSSYERSRKARQRASKAKSTPRRFGATLGP